MIPKHTRVTIEDVAAQAGVSIATVSRVVNGKYGVAPATATKVREVIEKIGYESSLIARSLRSSQTNVLGIVVADLEPFSAELLKGAARAIRGTGYELVVYSGSGHDQNDAGWERQYLSRLSGTLTDGTILVTPTVVDVATDVPVVAVDPHHGASRLPTIVSENREGARGAAEYLIGLGHTRIGFLAGRPDLESARLRELGFRDALRNAGIGFDPKLVRVGGFTRATSTAPATELLSMDPRPTAIFAANDESALETMSVARSMGISIPAELSIVGFDNIPESVMADPPLTTVDQSIQEMGFEAAKLLIELISRPTDESVYLTLPTKLVVRQSCRPPDS